MPTKEESHLIKTDAVIAEVIASVPSPQIVSTNNVFHDLMSCVLEQQIHYRSTKKVFEKMLAKSNLTLLTLDNFSVFEKHAFDGIKLSAKKYETVLNIVEHWKEHKVDWEKLTDEAVISELSKIKGVGKWTIDMILLFTLQRPNIFPYDDFHAKQIMTQLYNLDAQTKLKAQMVVIAETWNPHKSTAFRYLLAWKKWTQKNRKR